MSLLDLFIVAAAAMAAVGGYRLGLVTRVVSWLGLGLGLVVAVRLAPALVSRIDPSHAAAVLVLTIGLLLVGASLGQALGFVVGDRLRPRRPDGPLARIDGALGGVAGIVGVVVLVWLMLPVLAVSPAWISRPVTTSWVARTIDARLPAPPDAMDALRDLVGDDRFPEVFDALRPTPDLGPPPAASGLDEATSDAVARSVVKVEGAACSRVQDGSGWVVGPDTVVTNAHVVAGQSVTQVFRDDGSRLDARLVAFDPARDLAVLDVDGLDRPALPIDPEVASSGTIGGVFGHPGGESLRIAPFEVSRPLEATGRDIYDAATTRRSVLELSAGLRPGDSGSALVDPSGEVVGVAFAIARDQPSVAYALATTELAPLLVTAAAGTTVSAGPCLD